MSTTQVKGTAISLIIAMLALFIPLGAPGSPCSASNVVKPMACCSTATSSTPDAGETNLRKSCCCNMANAGNTKPVSSDATIIESSAGKEIYKSAKYPQSRLESVKSRDFFSALAASHQLLHLKSSLKIYTLNSSFLI